MRTKFLLPMLPLLFAACSTMQQTGQVRDGVYEKPSGEALASTAPVDEPRSAEDDYYDPSQAGNYAGRGYYDMAYNDPYYYNYGRFGWGVGLGYGTGYGSPYGGSYWGMNSEWGSPYGYGGYGSPYGYGGCGNGWNDPWNSGYYGDPYYNGYGYYGYGGPCYGCYQPVVVYSNTIVGHRPTLGGGGGGGTTDGGGGGGTRTFSPANPMSLMSSSPSRTWSGSWPGTYTTDFSARPVQPMKPARQPWGTQPSDQGHETGERGNSGWNSGGGSTPSRSSSDGGGNQPVNGHRPR